MSNPLSSPESDAAVASSDLHSEGLSAASSSAVDSQSGETSNVVGGRRKLGVWLSILVAAILIAGVVGWSIWNRHPDRRFQRALASLKAKDYDAIADDLTILKAAGPRYEAHASLLQGALFARQGALEEALSELRYASEHPQTKGLALGLAGGCLFALGAFHDAERMLHVALQTDPDLVDVHRWLAKAYFDQGTMRLAMAHLTRVCELDPADPRPYYVLGLIHSDFDEGEAAIENFKRSLEMSPPEDDVQHIRTDLARAQFELLKYDDTLTTLAPARDTVDVLTMRAECYLAKKERLEEARKCLADALEKEPDSLRALAAQAALVEESGDLNEAVKILNRALEKHPDAFVVHYRLAQLYKRLDQPEPAKRHLSRSRQLQELLKDYKDLQYIAMEQPRDSKVRYQIGELAMHLDMPEIAKGWFRAALTLDRENHEAYAALQALEATTAPPPDDGAASQPK